MRLGYDPRKDPNAWIYQTFDYRIRQAGRCESLFAHASVEAMGLYLSLGRVGQSLDDLSKLYFYIFSLKSAH